MIIVIVDQLQRARAQHLTLLRCRRRRLLQLNALFVVAVLRQRAFGVPCAAVLRGVIDRLRHALLATKCTSLMLTCSRLLLPRGYLGQMWVLQDIGTAAAAAFVANACAQIAAYRRAVHGKLLNTLQRLWDAALRLAPRKVSQVLVLVCGICKVLQSLCQCFR